MIALNSWLKSALAATTVAGVLAACTVTTGPDTDTPDIGTDSGTRVDSGTTTDSGTDAGDAATDAGGETCDFPSTGVNACDACIQTSCVDAACGCFSSNLEPGNFSCDSYDIQAADCYESAEELPEEDQNEFITECIATLDEIFASNGAAGAVTAHDAFVTCAETTCASSCFPE